jgi:hypothetical protein
MARTLIYVKYFFETISFVARTETIRESPRLLRNKITEREKRKGKWVLKPDDKNFRVTPDYDL